MGLAAMRLAWWGDDEGTSVSVNDHPDPLSGYDAPTDDWARGRMNLQFSVRPFNDVSEALGWTFRAYADNFALIVKLTVLLLLAPIVLGHALEHALLGHGEAVVNAVALGRSAVDFVLWALLVPALIYAVVVRLRDGRRVPLGECLRWGVGKWLPTLGWGLVATVFWIVGCCLLIVPGLIAGAWFFMLMPVIALEDGSRGNAMARCIEVTRGYFWPVLGLLLILLLMLGGMSAAFWGLYVVLIEVAALPWPVAALMELIVSLAYPLMTVAAVVTYLAVRASRPPATTCLRCGYLLAGNVTGRCPECGEPVPHGAVVDLPPP